LILSDEPYVCSAECVLAWIVRRQENGPHLVGCEGMIYNEEAEKIKWFRSKFEERVFLFLENKNIKVFYEAYTFPVGSGFYTPDFYIPKGTTFLETKGLWRLGAKRKFRLFRKTYPNIPILIIPWTIQGEFK
jgi:predicted nuclease of restriction endonuclease-like RecB superfamily